MSDSEEETGGLDAAYKPSFVLIAIDTDPSMFLKQDDNPTPFKTCLSACYQLADSLIFTQNKRSWSPFGVILAREDSEASLVDFNQNVLNSIKFLKQQSSLSDDDLIKQYQRKASFDLSGFFLLCKKKFKEIQSLFYKRTIIYITNDDDPVRGDNKLRFAALNDAKNFEPNDIDFQMVTMNSNFDYTKFYNELYSVVKTPLIETLIEDEDGLLEKLSSLILVRYYQRRLRFFPFRGDTSRFLKVIQKNLVQEDKLYNNAYVTTDGKPVKKLTKNALEGPKSYRLFFKANQIDFDLQEYYDLKNSDLPIGYTLLYVGNRVTDVGCVLTNPAILELDYKETLPFFNSFWQYCVDKNKVLVCARKLKHLDTIRFVEFIPKFANNSRIFLIKTIPFSREIKRPPTSMKVEEEASVSEEKIAATHALINSLTFDYYPKMFVNPVLAKKKAFLRAKLLDEPQEDVEDVTHNAEAIDAQLSDVGACFKRLFHLGESTGAKRKGRAGPASSKRKK